MRPHRLRAVRPAAPDAELHAAADVVGRPARGAVRRHGADRAVERAVPVLGALPRVALVEMGVDVDQAGPELAVRQIDARLGAFPGFRRHHGGDSSVAYDNVDGRQPVGRDRHARRELAQERARHRRVAQAIDIPLGHGEEARRHLSPLA